MTIVLVPLISVSSKITDLLPMIRVTVLARAHTPLRRSLAYDQSDHTIAWAHYLNDVVATNAHSVCDTMDADLVLRSVGFSLTRSPGGHPLADSISAGNTARDHYTRGIVRCRPLQFRGTACPWRRSLSFFFRPQATEESSALTTRRSQCSSEN